MLAKIQRIIRKHRAETLLVFGSVLVALIVIASIVFQQPKQEFPPLLVQYGDIPILVGDTKKSFEKTFPNADLIKESEVSGNSLQYIVPSKRIPTLTNTVEIQESVVTFVEHQVSYQSAVVISDIFSTLNDAVFIEYRDEHSPDSQALLIYPNSGFAILFHPTIGEVQKIIQFAGSYTTEVLPKYDHFVLSTEIPEDVGTEENYAEFYVTGDESSESQTTILPTQ